MLKNNVYRAIIKRRTIRRFRQIPISLTILKKLVNAARLAPSAANIQPIPGEWDRIVENFNLERGRHILGAGTKLLILELDVIAEFPARTVIAWIGKNWDYLRSNSELGTFMVEAHLSF